MLTNGYVYAHKHDTGEGITDTWGVAVADEKGECFLCPDVSDQRKEAEIFAKITVACDIAPEDLQVAANAYLEARSCFLFAFAEKHNRQNVLCEKKMQN